MCVCVFVLGRDVKQAARSQRRAARPGVVLRRHVAPPRGSARRRSRAPTVHSAKHVALREGAARCARETRDRRWRAGVRGCSRAIGRGARNAWGGEGLHRAARRTERAVRGGGGLACGCGLVAGGQVGGRPSGVLGGRKRRLGLQERGRTSMAHRIMIRERGRGVLPHVGGWLGGERRWCRHGRRSCAWPAKCNRPPQRPPQWQTPRGPGGGVWGALRSSQPGIAAVLNASLYSDLCVIRRRRKILLLSEAFHAPT